MHFVPSPRLQAACLILALGLAAMTGEAGAVPPGKASTAGEAALTASTLPPAAPAASAPASASSPETTASTTAPAEPAADAAVAASEPAVGAAATTKKKKAAAKKDDAAAAGVPAEAASAAIAAPDNPATAKPKGPPPKGCTRLGFLVNDYGKDGPARDAQELLDKYVASWAAERGIKKYTIGPKTVECELFIDLILFDEHTCTASANVCY